MPIRPTSARASSSWLHRLLIALSLASIFLWLLPLLSSHRVLFPSGPNFEDIVVYRGRFSLFHTARFFTSRSFSAFAYPAGAAPVYAAFYATGDAIAAFLILSTAATLAALTGAFLYLRRNHLAHLFPWLLLFTFPLVFLIQRANIELVLWIIVALGILAWHRGLAWLAAILFGIGFAIKLYPILLLGLFLGPAGHRSRKNLSAFMLGIFAALLSMAAAIAYAGPTFLIAAQGFTTGVDRFQNHYVDTVSRIEVAFDHSLFSPFKYVTFLHHTSPAPFRHTYYIAAAIFALLLFLRVRKLPSLNLLIFLVAAMISLPPVSFTYTLTHLLVPIVLLLTALANAKSRPPATAVLTLILLLALTLPLASLSVLGFDPTGPLQSFLLLAVLILTALEPWPLPSPADTHQPR
jgi:hypothetical protein